jgi:hypothetical protein
MFVSAKRAIINKAPALLIAIALATGAVWWWLQPPAYTDACIETPAQVIVCAASDMARVSRTGAIPLDHPDFDLSQGSVQLRAAKNETVAFQLIFRTGDNTRSIEVSIDNSHWLTQAGKPVNEFAQQIFQAHYHYVGNGAYSWGPKTAVLPWPADYPDALIPQSKACGSESQTLFSTISLPATKARNQALWIDTYVPPTIPAGRYQQTLTVKLPDDTLTIPINLIVFDTTLPDRPSFDAIGELYRTYRLEGAGEDPSATQWQVMSHCYQQLAHQHRMVFMERTPDIPTGKRRDSYIQTFGPALTGKLFTAEHGYIGTGQSIPVSVWRTPWPQEYNVTLKAALDDATLERYTDLSREWAKLVDQQGWGETSFFAYIFDEVDGPHSGPDTKAAKEIYLAMVHLQMERMQKALDAGAPQRGIDLLWTSHANPASWADNADLDLTAKVRLWSPNASAADPGFLAERISEGNKAWFYHSGHPAVGAHSINASGIEMRTWGVIAARYGLQGNFMWAVNLGSDERPFAEPSYKPDDDRFGNGVMVYPGNQLDKIGFDKAPGPIPSMRLKAWRRGLQDAELFLLAKEQDPVAADMLIEAMIPAALADAEGKAQWPQDPAAWIDFKAALLALASQ